MADTKIIFKRVDTQADVPILAHDNGDGTFSLATYSAGGSSSSVTIAIPSATFTRPADTTAYSVNDLVANSTTAGSVTPMSITAAKSAAGSFQIPRVRLYKSGTSTTNATFRAHFYDASPTVANGDNGAFSTNKIGTGNYLGAFVVTMTRAGTDGATGIGVPEAGSALASALASGQTIYCLLEALAAYTPANGETFGLIVETFQN